MSKGKKKKVVVYRNHFVPLVKFKTGAGVHEKTNKAKRKKQKQNLKKENRDFFQVILS